jgi:hypothetical protein
MPVAGGRFTVRREGEGERVRGATLDGRTLALPLLHHAELSAGSELVVTLGE